MVFKLVQLDSDCPFKIKLEPGTHIFGRGKFLKVNDKRISRIHGQFEVTDDSLIITALHHNPCFYQKNGSTEAEVLRQNNSINLTTGDKLGLLPTSYWYEVLICLSKDDENTQGSHKECVVSYSDEATVDADEVTDKVEHSRLSPEITAKGDSDNDKQDSQSTEVLLSHELDIALINASAACKFDKKQHENDEDLDKLQVEKTCISSTNETHAVVEPGSPSSLTTNKETKDLHEAVPTSSDQPSATQKRSHSVCEDKKSDEVKKIKTEDDVEVNIKPDSDDQQAGSSNSNNDGAKPPTVPLRERCMYGVNCYRRNPAHMAQFSHPQDADWGAGDKAPCPWGSACGKRDPRHWRDHDHPPGKEQPPPQPGTRKRKAKRNHISKKTRYSASDGSDRDSNKTDGESDELHKLIVTGKRVRKPVRKDSLWSASDDDSDPYKTDDESDEWEPSSEYTESQN